MLKKFFLGLCALLLVAGGIVYTNQDKLLLALVKYRSANEYAIGPPRVIDWDEGPAEAAVDPARRPPNIILIVADDLGYNDISTFGGGVADGRVKTPHIDALAADGAVFTQSYSGAGTCAPSRAMMMTGRYPTRTGFEFTPMPSGMGAMVSRISAGMDSGLPPVFFDAELDASKPPYETQGLPPEEALPGDPALMLSRAWWRPWTAGTGSWSPARPVHQTLHAPACPGNRRRRNPANTARSC